LKLQKEKFLEEYNVKMEILKLKKKLKQKSLTFSEKCKKCVYKYNISFFDLKYKLYVLL